LRQRADWNIFPGDDVSGDQKRGDFMNTQPWKTSVEIEELGNRHYVRVIEDGVVSVKGFHSRADAKAFAQGEQARLGLDTRHWT
jgi:hypothetical protein